MSHHSLGLLAIVLVLLTSIRLIGLRFSVTDLFYDESQYWSWAQDPALGYPSKPPLLAWLLTGVHHVCGDSEWCVKSPAPVIYLATCLVIYLLGRQLYDGRLGFWAAILAAFAPGVIFSSRIISTDVPLLFFWAIALFAYIKILQAGYEPQRLWSILLGLALGLGLLAKYAMIYFIPGMLLASIASDRARDVWKRPAPWIAILIAAVLVAPNVAWNAVHSFTTFRETGNLVLGAPFQLSAARGAEFLASQLLVMGPVVFAIALTASIRFRSGWLVEQDRLMLAFFISPVAVVTLFAVYSKANANWAAPAAISATVACTAILMRFDRRSWLWASIALGVLLQCTLIVTDAIATRLPLQIGGFINPYYRVLGWRDFAERAGTLATSLQAQAIAADDRRTFESLRYYWRDQSQRVVSWEIAGEPSYELTYPLAQSTPEPILFVTNCPDVDRLKPYYSVIEPLGLHPNADVSRVVHFYAFKLSQVKGHVDRLGPCPLRG